MSAFTLCWCRDGSPVPAPVRKAISALLRARSSAPVREGAGDDWVGWIAPTSWAGDAEAALPLAHAGWTGSAVLRLDDRERLAAQLRDAAALGGGDDATLAFRSLQAWGDEAPARWSGDYALAAVAPGRDRLVVACGEIGVIPCFHASVGAMSIVADDPSVIAAVPGVDIRLEERAVAEYLATGGLVTPTITFRRGIARVPGGHTLVVLRDGASSLRRHWSLPTPEIRRRAEAPAVIEEFGAILATAVRDRLRADGATLLLSGGLDSAAIAVAMADLGVAPRSRAVTVTWRSLLPNDDEMTWAARTAAVTGLRHEEFAMSAALGLSVGPAGAVEPAPDPEPEVYRGIAAHLARLAPVALIGEDMDLLLAAPTFLDVVRSEGMRNAVLGWRRSREATGARPWLGLRRPTALEPLRERRARVAPGWLRAGVLERHPLPDVPPARPHRTRSRAARMFAQPTWENVLWNDSPPMSGAPVRFVLPFMDPRVIAFCFSLPALPWTQRKHLLRRALHARLPNAVVERPKTSLDGYYAARVREWRRLGVPTALPSAVAGWVVEAPWLDAMAHATDADEVMATRRVLELARWLATSEP